MRMGILGTYTRLPTCPTFLEFRDLPCDRFLCVMAPPERRARPMNGVRRDPSSAAIGRDTAMHNVSGGALCADISALSNCGTAPDRLSCSRLPRIASRSRCKGDVNSGRGELLGSSSLESSRATRRLWLGGSCRGLSGEGISRVDAAHCSPEAPRRKCEMPGNSSAEPEAQLHQKLRFKLGYPEQFCSVGCQESAGLT